MTLDKDGTLEAVALTDGTATISNGAISSVTTLTATTLTDGTASITGGKYTTTVAATGGGDTSIARHWIRKLHDVGIPARGCPVLHPAVPGSQEPPPFPRPVCSIRTIRLRRGWSTTMAVP